MLLKDDPDCCVKNRLQEADLGAGRGGDSDLYKIPSKCLEGIMN